MAYRQALDAYGNGDLEGALESMQRSYSLSGRQELLFNLAGLERELQHCQGALHDYQGYLTNVPNGKYRAEAQQAEQELKSECPADSATGAESLASPPPPAVAPDSVRPVVVQPLPASHAKDEPYWTTGRMIGWSAIASGVVSGGAALYFLNAALSDRKAVADSASKYKYAPPDPPWTEDLESQHRNDRAAQVFGVTAGALVVSGAVLLLIDPKSMSSTQATVAAYPGYLGAACSGSF